MKRRPNGLSLEAAYRYLAPTGAPDECWPWPHARNPRGYGKLGHGGSTVDAHKAAYLTEVGAIPAGHVVRHTCDNPPCCNPHHLITGTYADNSADAIARDRLRRGDNHPNRKLLDVDVAVIRMRYAAGGILQRELAAEFGVTEDHVHRIVRGLKRCERSTA